MLFEVCRWVIKLNVCIGDLPTDWLEAGNRDMAGFGNNSRVRGIVSLG